MKSSRTDAIKRIAVVIIFGLFISYLVYLLINKRPIVSAGYRDYNLFLNIILILLSVYISVFYGIYPIKVKFSRATLFVIGLAVIMISKVILANDPINGVYIWDIGSILGVFILITGPTNLLVGKKIKNTIAEKDIEIIEV